LEDKSPGRVTISSANEWTLGDEYLRILLMVLVLWTISTAGATWLVINEPLAHADALLVLAGAQVYPERVQHAAELFLPGKGARILLTNDGQRGRWSRALQRNPTSVETATTALERAGVPLDRIDVLSGIVHGTSDEAAAVKHYAGKHELRTLVAVTSPYHSRRTVWTLRQILRKNALRLEATRYQPRDDTETGHLVGKSRRVAYGCDRVHQAAVLLGAVWLTRCPEPNGSYSD
jgi:vancomycin permeability regulator SanA